MNWLREHKLFSVIAGIVLVLCLVIIVSFLSAGGSSFIGRGTHKVVHVIETPLSYVTSGVRNTVAGVFRYSSLLKENEELKEQVAKLEQENKDLTLSKDDLNQLERLSGVFKFDPYKNKRSSIAARITEIDYSNPFIVFTVDRGTEEGIKNNSIVVDGNGLVGKVFDCGKGWSKVVSILSENNNVSFKVLRRTSVTGVISANSEGELSGYVMNDRAKIVKGDTLVTSGIGVYPEGIIVGKVSTVDYDEDRQLKVITVRPSVDFESLQKVAIFK